MPAEAKTREHLANERTLLAWVRTGIALLGFGVLIAKLRFLVADSGIQVAGSHFGQGTGERSTILGVTFCVVGLATLIFASIHYNRTLDMIEAQNYVPRRQMLNAFVAVIALLALVSIGFLINLSPR